MPDIAHPAIGLTGHLPAAKASEVIEAGKGRGRRERKRGGKFAARHGLMEGSVHLFWGQRDEAWLLVPALRLPPPPGPLALVTPHCSAHSSGCSSVSSLVILSSLL